MRFPSFSAARRQRHARPCGPGGRAKAFHLFLIKPTRYDDEGYPIHWDNSPLPSNTLACLYGIANDCKERRVLGADVDIAITAIDETSQFVDVARLLRRVQRDGAQALVALVGVQSNQFPRAIDLARQFRQHAVPVCIGGFHVSGCLSMLAEHPPEIRDALAAGISLFAGEAEDGRFDQVLQDAYSGALRPIYNFVGKMPALEDQPLPTLPAKMIQRTLLASSSFDLGRGCPFECSFCCIINVQGRKSRFRSADDLEAIIRANAKINIHEFFITDDNLARNWNWEACFDRLIKLREEEGVRVSLQIQVDTLCHRIPGFIDKATRAGVDKVFIGLENINPDNLALVKKRQNRITEYREMLLAWKKHPVVITCGYIVGFPNDTGQSILGDIDIIKRELPIDCLYLTFLTPLPGSEDHKRLLASGVWMDPDLNKYDLSHRVTHHSRMSDEEWERTFREAWQRFYTPDHVETVLRRAAALGSNKRFTTASRLFYYGELTRIHGEYTIDMGMTRRRRRNERRPGLPKEGAVAFYARCAADILHRYTAIYPKLWSYRRLARRIWADPARFSYTDRAITTLSHLELGQLDLLTKTRGDAGQTKKSYPYLAAAE